jgi:hypothetical protein
MPGTARLVSPVSAEKVAPPPPIAAATIDPAKKSVRVRGKFR